MGREKREQHPGLCDQSSGPGGRLRKQHPEAVGKRGVSHGVDLIRALAKLGVKTGGKVKRVNLDYNAESLAGLPARCIIRARNRRAGWMKDPRLWRWSHYILIWDLIIYDPAPPCTYNNISSYIEIL